MSKHGIVFLGFKRSGSVREAVTAAERLGMYTVVITDKRSLMRDRQMFPDVHLMQYTGNWNPAMLREIIESLPSSHITIAAIVSFVDPLVSVAAELAKKYCGTNLSLPAIRTMEDKIETRIVLERKCPRFNPVFQLCSPWDTSFSVIEPMSEHLPVVIKMPDGTGSTAVRRALNRYQFEQRLAWFRSEYPRKTLLLEEYLKGPQYLVEVMVNKGSITPIAVIKQHMLNRSGYMVVDGYAVLLDPEPDLGDMMKSVTDIIQAFEMDTGTCHLELRQGPDGQWKLIEVNPRISGSAMNRMIQVAYGINYVEETLKLILGEQPDVAAKIKRHVYTKFVTSDVSSVLLRVRGKHRAKRLPGVEEVFVSRRRGQRVYRTRSMGHRYAYIIAADDHSLQNAEDAAFRAAQEIEFVLERSDER